MHVGHICTTDLKQLRIVGRFEKIDGFSAVNELSPLQDGLYFMRLWTGNQCSVYRSGLNCSAREDLKMKRAGTFWATEACVRDSRRLPLADSCRSLIETGRALYKGFHCVVCQVLSD